jgi:3-oxoisoapionate kinase
VNSEAPSNLLMGFIGDDFTGSTDAMESLARHGIRTVLFTTFPNAEQLGQYPGLNAFGVAGLTRSVPTEEIDGHIRPMLVGMREFGVPIVHYKTCSTFDSSPTIGSIGRVIDVGMEVLASEFVPVVVGAPALGRYCVFGNLFARYGGEGEIFRLDRHPSMSRHPVTPMKEADLMRHLGEQTGKAIALLDVASLEMPLGNVERRLGELVEDGAEIVMMDVLHERHLGTIGALLTERTRPLFVVGSSGVESALCAHWEKTGEAVEKAEFARPGAAKPIVAVCGSCSPVTGGQIEWAIANGFVEVIVGDEEAAKRASAAIGERKSVCLHTGGTRAANRGSGERPKFGEILGQILLDILRETPVRRMVVAGGDTASQLARVLEIDAVEMIGELTRGSPLCRITSENPLVNGKEITFKGGQIGNQDFFGLVERGF